MTDGEQSTYFLFLQEDHGRLRHDTDRPPLDLARDGTALRTMLAALTETGERDVEISGRLYRTVVQVVRADTRTAYVETDPDGVPVAEAATRKDWKDSRVRRYLRRLSRRWRSSEGLTADTRLPVDECFIPPTFERVDGTPGASAREVLSWDRVRRLARLVVLGGPGTGKTTLMRRILAETRDEAGRRSDTLPIYIPLREFSPDDLTLTVEGLSRLLASEWPGSPVREVADLSSSTRIMVILDGLDELARAADRAAALQRVDELCRQMPHVRVRLTSRDFMYSGELPGFDVLRIRPFTGLQMRAWTRQYLAARRGEDEWRRFLGQLDESPAVAELVRNPLLLTVVAALFANHSLTPHDEAAVYRELFDVLVKDWDLARGIARYEDPAVTPRLIDRTLSEVSVLLTDTRRNHFTEHDVARITAEHVGIRCQPIVFLDACRSAGLVRAANRERYVFVHRSLQEYLAARHLVGSTADLGRYLSAHGDYAAAQRIWRLSCSIASEPERLLEAAMVVDRLAHWQRATLLADALTQSLSAQLAIARRCCDYVVGYLETTLSGLLEDPTVAASPESPAWSATVSVVGVAAEEAEQFGRVAWAVHRTRLGSVVDLMR